MTSHRLTPGRERAAGADSDELPYRASAAAADDELERASDSRVEAADSCGRHLSECGIA